MFRIRAFPHIRKPVAFGQAVASNADRGAARRSLVPFSYALVVEDVQELRPVLSHAPERTEDDASCPLQACLTMSPSTSQRSLALVTSLPTPSLAPMFRTRRQVKPVVRAGGDCASTQLSMSHSRLQLKHIRLFEGRSGRRVASTPT